MNQKCRSKSLFPIFPPTMKAIQEKLFEFWKANKLDLKHNTTLLAISGGIDSMLLARIFLDNNFPFAIAHMNYQLRGAESNKDATFVEDWAEKHDVEFHLKVDDLSTNGEQNTQIAARNARYNWFKEVMEKTGFTYLATAHHLQDSIETSLINFGRGTGIKGLTGIPIQREYIIRPLLCLTPLEISELCDYYQIKWREDQSNAEQKYLRNKIRHKIIPALENIFPNFFHTQQITIQNIKSDFNLINELVNSYKQKMIQIQNDSIRIDLSIIESHPERNQLLFYLLHPWEFSVTQIEQFWTGFPSSETKKFSTQIVIGNLKGKILMIDTELKQYAEHYSISKEFKVIKTTRGILEFSIVSTPEKFELNANEAYFDLEQIEWPMMLRNWLPGDSFQPFGMHGKHQKLQDFFSNLKLNAKEKQQQLLLCNNDKIIWIVGRRNSHYCSVKPEQQKCLKVTWAIN